jgi:hypothetical protein
MLSEGNQIHNFISSSGPGTVINYGSGSDFLTSYGSGSTGQKVTVTQRCLKRLGPALLLHDVALVLSNVLQDPLLEDRRHVQVAEQEEPSPVGLTQNGGQGVDTVLLQLFHFVLVRRSQELLRKKNSLNYGSRYNSTPGEQYCRSAASGAGLRSNRIWTPLDLKLFSSVSDPPSLTRMYGISSSVGVGDPNPDPQELYVFGPPGSGSISQRYGSGSSSGSFPFLK